MKNIMYKYLRRLIISFFIINGFNYICANAFIFIPINVITLLFVTLLGMPGIIVINLIYFIV